MPGWVLELAEIKKDLIEQVVHLRRNLERFDSALLTKLGAVGTAYASKSFRDQRFGNVMWDPRYPREPEPFINIAGTVQDFKDGRTTPKSIRFYRRPALVDEGKRGGMWGSLTWNVTGPQSVRWGSPKPYAAIHQKGGVSEISVTPETKKRMDKYFHRAEKSPETRAALERKLESLTRKIGSAGSQIERVEMAKKIAGVKNRLKRDRSAKVGYRYQGTFVPHAYVRDNDGERRPATRSDYAGKFAWLLRRPHQTDMLVTHVARRPFLPDRNRMPDDLKDQIKKAVRRHYNRIQRQK